MQATMHHTIESKTIQQNVNFTSPQTMLQGLLVSMTNPCNCGQVVQHDEELESQTNEQIKSLQMEIKQIRSQVIQVRDTLYKELDGLREEREEIEGQIESCSIEQTETVKYSNYHEMNERLRRRIYEIREYIQKMTFQNQRIEEGIITNQYNHMEEEQIYQRRREFNTTPYEQKRYNLNNFQTMVARLHEKQDEAWRRVRRQEEEIDRRNMQARSRKGTGFTYHSPKSRTFFSPGRQIY